MAFVLSDGSVRSLSRPSYPSPQRIQLSGSFAADYFEIWRTQESVRTVVSFLARNIAQLGLHLYQRNGDNDRERVTDHELARLFRRPNPWTTRYRMINGLIHDLAIYDVAYWSKTKVDNKTRGLVRMPPQMVAPKGDNWLTPEYFEVRGRNGTKEIAADQMVYFRGYGGTEDAGVSPLESLRQMLREAWTASEMREQIMKNGARASGYIERPADTPGVTPWSTKAKQRFKEDWQSQYAWNGPQAGGTPILEDGMSFKAASQSAKDLQYIEGMKLTREMAASAYFIPPPMVGILDHATFGNIEEQHKMLYQDCLGPWLIMTTEEIELQLIPDFVSNPDEYYAEFNLREKLTGDFVTRAAALQTAVGGPYLLINEARAMDNRPPVEGGDELIKPLNVTQNGDQNPVPAGGASALIPTEKPEPAPDDELDQED